MMLHARRYALLLGAPLLVLGLLVVLATTGGDLSSAQQGSQLAATATPEPTLTPSPSDMAVAAEFAVEGRIDAAIGAYRAVIDQGTLDERLTARQALARVHVNEGEPALAVEQLDAYLLEAPAEADVRAAQYSLAEALSLQGDWEGALRLYDVYIRTGGGASAYARIDRVLALVELGQMGRALAEAEVVLAEELPNSVRLPFLLSMAQQLEPTRPADALAFYERLTGESSSPADQALALWRSAIIQDELGNGTALADAWPTVIQRFPQTSTAEAIVDAPPEKTAALDPYFIGLVYYRGGHSAEAREAFRASVAAGQGGGSAAAAARSSYYLAILDERDGNVGDAVAGYGRVLEIDPTVEQADDALWWQGRLLEETGRRSEAAVSYQRLVDEIPGSDRASEARFRLAIFPYDDGRFGDAAEAFNNTADAAEGRERQRALLWQGKALTASGDREAGDEAWQTLREESPADYYGLRAALLLGEAGGQLEDAGLSRPIEPDWGAIESWLRDVAEEDPAGALEALLYDDHWGLGQELLALGMRGRAHKEFRLLLELADDDPGMLYQTARFFHSAGLDDLSARAATRLLNALPEATTAKAPVDVWRLAYPVPFVELLREASDAEGAPDVLVLALLRQESFFDPRAGSTAGALGLAQVIPSTGREIAEALGVDDFQVELLFRPVVSLRFGAYYIQRQVDAFGGNIYYGLAAYNGGAGNSQRWQDAAGGSDVDRFIEEITFSETRSYVRLVAENLARYRQLYTELEEPALPGD